MTWGWGKECDAVSYLSVLCIRSLRAHERCSDPITTHEVETLLLLGGLDKVKDVISHPTVHGRRQAVKSFYKKLNPQTNPKWRDMWDSLGVASKTFDLEKVPGLNICLPSLHLVWTQSALRVLLPDPIVGAAQNITSNQTRLMGMQFSAVNQPSSLEPVGNLVSNAIQVEGSNNENMVADEGEAHSTGYLNNNNNDEDEDVDMWDVAPRRVFLPAPMSTP